MKKTCEHLTVNKEVVDTVAKKIQEASSVLRYSFYLPQIEEDITKNECLSFELIEEINNEIYKNLKSFIGGNKYDIFGYNGKYGTKKSDLSYLVTYDIFWKHIFKQHAILSTYDKLRKIIGQSVSLSSYNLYKYSNYTNDIEKNFYICHHGLDFLLGLNSDSACQKLNCDQFCLEREDNTRIPTDRISQYSPNFTRQIKSLNKKLCSMNLLNPLIHTKESSYAARLDLLEFYEFCVLRKDKNPDNSFEVLNILNTYKKRSLSYKDYCQYMCSVGKMFNTIKNNESVHKLSLSDRIYLAYKIEKLLAPITIDCLYQNIFNIEKDNPLKSDHDYMVNSCLQLPNVFTRQYILQIAIDTIAKHFNEEFTDEYFFTNITENLESIGNFIKKKNFISTQQKFYLLINRYKSFIDYITLIVFPLYENYFFCTLWNSISKLYDNNIATFINFYKKLSIYLNDSKNIEDIFNIEKIITDYNINYNSIIKTDFINNKDIYGKRSIYDKTLYYECINALKTTSGNNNIPDFISLDYISGNYFEKKSAQETCETKFKQHIRVNVIKNILKS